MSSRANEYSLLMFEILLEDAKLREQGLPGLSVDELNQLRLMVQSTIERIENGIEKRRPIRERDD